MYGKAAVARCGLALRAGQRVLLVGLGVQIDGEAPAHLAVAHPQQLVGRTADHDPVFHSGPTSEKFVPNRATYQVNLHDDRIL